MEANLDRGEIVTKQLADELIGETLLQAEYSISNEQKMRTRSGFRNVHESTVLDRPVTPAHLRQSVMHQTKPFNPSDFNSLERNITPRDKLVRSVIDRKNSFKLGTSRNDFENLNNAKKSTNILVINSQEETQDDNYLKPPQTTKVFSNNDPTVGFASRPKIQRTPDQSINMKKSTIDSIIPTSTHSSVQSASSTNFELKYSIAEPRPSSAKSMKSMKSPSQSNASNATLKNS